MKRLTALLVASVLLSVLPVYAQSEEVRPVILVYTGIDQGFAEMLAPLIEENEDIDSEVQVVTSPETLSIAAALPQTECIIIYASNEAELEGLEDAITTFFLQGGGVIGIRDACYEPYAGKLATEVFPTHANESKRQMSPRETRARTYVKQEDTSLTEGLPEKFDLISMGTYYPADSEGNYLESIDQDKHIPYKDEEIGSPLVIANDNENGGKSIGLPGIWTIGNSRVDVYYGNLVAQEEFQTLFSNIVQWTAKESSRFRDIEEGLEEKIEEAKGKAERLKEEAEEARRKEETQRLIFLIGVWAAGLIVCGVIVKKMILVPIEPE